MFVVIALASFLPAGNLAAQSLEETYAKLCSKPVEAKTEACQILSKSLVEKLQAQASGQGSTTSSTGATSGVQAPDAATLALWRKRWGVLLDMAGKETFNVAGPGLGFTLEQKLSMLNGRGRTEWRIPGEELVSSSMGPDGGWVESSTTRWDASSERLSTTFPSSATPFAYSAAQPDGSVQMLEATYGGMTIRGVTYRISSGRYENVSEKKENGNWVEATRTQTVEYSPERLAQQRLTIQLEDQQRVQQLAQQQQAERQEKRAKSAERAAMFNSVVQGVAQGFAEADTGGYAESQANLNATVADIQHAAAVERQQQLYAEQQKSQARASQDRQDRYDESQVLAANAEAAAERVRQAGGNPTHANGGIDAQPRPIATAARQAESSCSEAPGFRKIFGYAEKTRELAMRSMMETPHLEPLQEVSCTQPPNLGYTLEGWWKCTAMAPTGLMVKHCPQSNSGVSSQ